MSYVGSYIWKIRQKIGHDLLVVPTVGVAVVREDGKIMMVLNKAFGAWEFSGGCCEDGDNSWSDCALTEIKEEGGVVAKKEDLVPFATVSGGGWVFEYDNGDKLQCYTMYFELKKWQTSTDQIDDSEIAEVGFYSLDEMSELNLTKSAKTAIEAYKKYLETSKFQMVEVEP